MFMLMLQYVVSMKAGLVNHVEGDVNIKATQSLEAGAPIKTGPGGFAEILLNPGSYLRLGENSEAVLDSIELKNIALRIVSGAAVIEAVGIDKRFPLKVTSGDLAAEIIKNGIYTFADGRVTIVQGALRPADNKKAVFKKGWQVSREGGYGALKVKKGDLMPVEAWSRERSKVIAVANDNIARSLRRTSSSFAVGWDGWLWVPALGGYAFIPTEGFRSPYGYEYQSLRQTNYGISPVAGNGVSNENSTGNINSSEGLSSSPLPDSNPSMGGIDGASEPATSSGGISNP
jgi:hypothetical protein